MPDGSQPLHAERTVTMPVQHRLAPISKVDKDARTFELTWAAGAQVRRYDFYNEEIFLEELEMTREACDLSRLNGGAPLLNTHQRWDLESVLGVVERAWIENGIGGAAVRMSGRDEVKPIAQDVADKIVRNVSVGYDIHEIREMPRDPKTGYRVMRVTKWTPTEISFVPIGADQKAQSRAEDKDARQIECKVVPLDPERSNESEAPPKATDEQAAVRDAATIPAQTATPGETAMSEAAVVTPAAGAPAADDVVRMSPVEIEKARIATVAKYARANDIPARIEEQWIREGASYETIAEDILAIKEERGKTKPTRAADLGMSPTEQQRYSVFKVLRLLSARNHEESQRAMEDAAFELEASRTVAKQLGRKPDGVFIPGEILRRPVGAEAARALTAQPGSAGGYLVDTDNLGFIEILRNRSVLSRMGARTLSGLEGNVAIPRQTGSATLTWQAGETAAATATDQTFGQLSMTPKTAIAVTEIGRTLMMQSSPSSEGLVMSDLAQVVALGVDLAGIQGTGGAQPLGIISTPGISSGQDASSADYAKILAFQSTAAGSNAILGGPGYITRPATAAALMARSRFSNTDTPLWDGNILDGKMAGFGAMSSLQVPSGNLIFGSFNEVIIGEWGVLELSMNPFQSFNAGVVGIRAIYTVDVLIRYPQSFVRSTNAS